MPRWIANDNISTPQLKCEHCNTRAHLESITSLGDCELRSFRCDRCGRTKILRIRDPSRPRSDHSLGA